MTYEEAYEIVDSDASLCEFKRMNERSNKAYDMVIDACERADKYRWHDLRKNPDDVPYKDMRYDKHSEEFSILFDAPKVIGIDKHGQVTGHIEGVNGKYFCARTRNEIVAWKYLEPFEVD